MRRPFAFQKTQLLQKSLHGVKFSLFCHPDTEGTLRSPTEKKRCILKWLRRKAIVASKTIRGAAQHDVVPTVRGCGGETAVSLHKSNLQPRDRGDLIPPWCPGWFGINKYLGIGAVVYRGSKRFVAPHAYTQIIKIEKKKRTQWIVSAVG